MKGCHDQTDVGPGSFGRSFVYFIFALRDGISQVKIGHSYSPKARMREVCRGPRYRSFFILGVIEFPSGREAYRAEQDLHRYFSADRVEHEWFHYSDALRSYLFTDHQTEATHGQA